jgi:drug/metabolite transporter (DMT)-like permease
MDLRVLLGLCAGMVGAIALNVGKGVQKQKVHVFLQGRGMFAPPYRRDLGIWLIGLSMTASAMFFFPVGISLSKSPSAISAMTGVGLIGLLIYAVLVIGEKVGWTDAIGVALVVLGTSTLGLLGSSREAVDRHFSDPMLWLAIGSTLLVLGALCIGAWRWWRRIHGIAFGTMAGLLIGSAMFLFDAARVRAGTSFGDQLQLPHLYVAIVFSVAATVVSQLGFLRGRALEVVPAVNSATILSPLLLEVVIYGARPDPFDVVLIGVILVGVFLLSVSPAVAGAEQPRTAAQAVNEAG